MIKRVMLHPLAGAAMLAGGMAVAVLHHDWTAVALLIAGLVVMMVNGSAETPGARP